MSEKFDLISMINNVSERRETTEGHEHCRATNAKTAGIKVFGFANQQGIFFGRYMKIKHSLTDRNYSVP